MNKSGEHVLTGFEAGKLRTEFQLHLGKGYTFSPERNRLSAKIHNDTEWQVIRLRVRIQIFEDGNPPTTDQTYEMKGYVEPFSDGDLTELVDFNVSDKQKWSASVIDAIGRPRDR